MSNNDEDDLLREAVRRFAVSRFEALASKLIEEVKGYPSCGMLSDDEGAENLWDDYCYDQQNGPVPELEFAWAEALVPHLNELIAGLHQTEATLLTFEACWSQSLDTVEIIGYPPNGIYADALATEITNVVSQIALDRGWREEDEDCEEDEDDEDYDRLG